MQVRAELYGVATVISRIPLVVLWSCSSPCILYRHQNPPTNAEPFFWPPAGQLFGQLVDLLAFYTAFPIDNNTAQALSEQDVQQRHYDKVPHHPVTRQRTLLMC